MSGSNLEHLEMSMRCVSVNLILIFSHVANASEAADSDIRVAIEDG